MDLDEYNKTNRKTEEENRTKFNEEKARQQNMVFKAREQAYLDNKKNS